MKKNQQLGMNAGTAAHRLVKDLLFKFITDAGHRCHRCHGVMSREDFSIEHKDPWLDSADPFKAFFDLENIGFSHKSCNTRAARKPNKLTFSSPQEKLEHTRANRRRGMRKWYTPSKRHEKYLRTGT